MIVKLLECQQCFEIIDLSIIGCQTDMNVFWFERLGKFVERQDEEAENTQVFGDNIYSPFADIK